MKERPILFSAAMVRAIFANTKTQTRRTVKLPDNLHPDFGGRSPLMLALDDEGVDLYLHSRALHQAVRCPYGAPADRLWVREAWCTSSRFDRMPPRDIAPGAAITYLADGEHHRCSRYRPPMFMPRWASRITLEVTAVRIERLQDISEDDAQAEGVIDIPMAAMPPGTLWAGHATAGCELHAKTAAGAYRLLWESINGAGSWDANPWVWVLSFKRVEA